MMSCLREFLKSFGAHRGTEPKPTKPPEASPLLMPSRKQAMEADDHLRAARAIVDLEARRNKAGHIIAYELPGNDGGIGNGISYEYAGINGKYHPAAVRKIHAMSPPEREDYCARYIDTYTRKFTGFSRGALRPGTEFFILDCCWNRGPGGSAWIVQDALRSMGLSLSRDKQWGPVTRKMAIDADFDRGAEFVSALRVSRERYERKIVGYRANLWRGLENRWNKSHVTALKWNA